MQYLCIRMFMLMYMCGTYECTNARARTHTHNCISSFGKPPVLVLSYRAPRDGQPLLGLHRAACGPGRRSYASRKIDR